MCLFYCSFLLFYVLFYVFRFLLWIFCLIFSLFLFFPSYNLVNLINIIFPVLSHYFFPSFFFSNSFLASWLSNLFLFFTLFSRLFSVGLCISVWLRCLCGISGTHTHTHTLFHLCALSRGERALYNEKFTAVWWPLVSCKHIVQPRVKLGMEVKPFCRLTNIRLISISTSEIQTFTINFIVVWCVFNGHCSAEGQIKELRNTFQ